MKNENVTSRTETGSWIYALSDLYTTNFNEGDLLNMLIVLWLLHSSQHFAAIWGGTVSYNIRFSLSQTYKIFIVHP